MFLKNRLDNLALHADAAAVDDANLAKTLFNRLIKIFLDHDMDFLRLEGMEVYGILDWDVVHGESI